MVDKKTKPNEFFNKAKRHVEAQIKAQQDEQRRKLLQKRVEYVTNGAKALTARKPVEAAASFRNYVKLLEEWKGIPDGGLTPSNFEVPKDLGDLLLLAGVYWELAKIFDRTASDEKISEFRHYLEKYVLFARGTSFQPLCAESVRRYMKGNKALHKKDFKNAYLLLGGEKCFVVTSLLDVTEPKTLPVLRRFRDRTLARSFAGRSMIRTYYFVGPALARVVDRLPQFCRKTLGAAVDRIADRVKSQ